MIIELSKHFSEFEENHWLRCHSAIEHLIHAHGQGWHLFAPAREISKSIIEKCDLSHTQKKIISYYIYEKLPTLRGQAISADRTLVCFPDGVEMVTERRNQIPVRLSIFNDLHACAPSQLITENATIDGPFLEFIAKRVGRQLGYLMNVKLEQVHGGGGTTGALYQAACHSVRPALCVVDSDRKYPDGPLGDTARNVGLCNGGRFHQAITSFAYPVREFENIIPISTLLDVYSDNSSVLRDISLLTSYIVLAKEQGFFPCPTLSFIDLKAGLKRSDIAKMPAHIQPLFVRFSKHARPQERHISTYDDLSDNTVIHPGVSHNMLWQVFTYLLNRGSYVSVFVRKLMNSPAWAWLEDLVRLILSFGAAGERLPVR